MTDPQRQSDRHYVSAVEAMDILGVRPQTLYAYVSRGWIHSISQQGLKDKLYLRDDLVRVGSRSLARAGHGAVAASAMNWGEPIFPTSITEITPDGPSYRGVLAADLVRSAASFEEVAGLLWSGELRQGGAQWPVSRSDTDLLKLMRSLSSLKAADNVLETFSLVVLLLGLHRGSVAEQVPGGRTVAAAHEIIHAMVACCGFAGSARAYRPVSRSQSVVEGLTEALAVEATTENSEALRAILILLADHELSPGTLSARVVASAGGSLHACISAALCATSGLDVGRKYEQVQDFIGRAKTSPALVRKAQQLHARGQSVPGFEHPLYPKGDPRALQLLQLARQRQQQTPELSAVLGFIDRMGEEAAIFPRQELSVVVLSQAMGLSRQVPAALFALGRVAGWVAHVQEQRSSGNLLRPRAKFVKPE
jgi:citrate synthase